MIRFLFFICLLFCFSCEKEPEVNPLKFGIHINGDTDIDMIDVSDLDSILGSVHIIASKIENLEFLEGIEYIEGGIFASNNRLESLKGLESLKEIQTMSFNFNRRLEDFTAIENLKITQSLILYENGFSELPVLNNLVALKDEFTIDEEYLESVEFMQNLVQVDGNLSIIGSEKLMNIDALSNLESVGGELRISNNILLDDFCGIKNLLENQADIPLNIVSNLVNPSYQEILDQCN